MPRPTAAETRTGHLVLSRRRVAAGFAAVLAILVAWLLAASRTGEIPHRGRTLQVPLRAGSIPLRVSEGRARFLLPGSVDIKSLLVERGPALGWKFQEQLGAMYAMVSAEGTPGERLQVRMVTEAVMSQFVQVDVSVVPDPMAVGAP